MRRLGATLYEGLLLFAMAIVAGFALLPLVSPAAPGDATLRIASPFARTLLFCVLFAGAAVYYAWTWSEGRRTLPQKTWKLRVVDRAGSAPGRRQALVRYAAGWIGPAAAVAAYAVLRPAGVGRYAVALLALNYAWSLVDRDRQFLHDRVAGTRIVRTA